MILGYFLSFVPPSYLSVQQCLLHAIRPKDYVRDKYPEIENTWESYGLMETLVVDNAKHWHSASFEEACLRFGIIVQYAPPRTPWYKPSIERFFRSLNTRLIHLLPGKTFSNIFDKGDYDPKKNAVITLQELEKLLHHWIIDVYQQSKHRGIDDVPARLWKIGIDKHPPALPPNKEELQVLLGHITWRVISKSGVELFGLYYNDLSLARVRSGLKKGQKVKVKYDPTDLSIIYVHDPHDKRFVPTPAVDQGYTQGLSVWQHNIIRKLARQGVEDYVDIVKLCAARERIEGMVASAFKKLRKSGTNVKAARWMNDSQKGRRGTVERAEEGAAVSRDDSELDNADARSEAVNHSEAGISDIGTAFTADVDSNGGIAKGEGNKTNSSAVIGTQQTRKSKSGKGKKQNKAGAKGDPPVRPTRHREERNLDMTGWGVDYGSSK
jgi:putative transposase